MSIASDIERIYNAKSNIFELISEDTKRSDYTFYEYLDFSSITTYTYFDTGIACETDKELSVEGVYTFSTTATNRLLLGFSSGSNWYWGVDSSHNYEYYNTTIAVGEKDKVTFTYLFGNDNSATRGLYVNNTSYVCSGSYTSTYSNYIIGNISNSSSYQFYGKIYYVKVCLGGELQRLFIPASDGVTNGLYDLVTNTFYNGNNTTANKSLKVGDICSISDILENTYNDSTKLIDTYPELLKLYNDININNDIPLDILSNRIYRDGYKFYTYLLGGSSDVYINLQLSLSLSNTTKVIINGDYSEVTGTTSWIGANYFSQTNLYELKSYSNKDYIQYNTAGSTYTVKGYVGDTEITSLARSWSSSSMPTSSLNYYVFRMNGTSSTTAYLAKIHYIKIYDSGTLVRSMVPASNSSGEYGLYDLMNNVFYTNAGSSGTFNVGEERILTYNEHTPTGHIDEDGLRSIGWGEEDIERVKKECVFWDEEDDDLYAVDDYTKELYTRGGSTGVLPSRVVSAYRSSVKWMPMCTGEITTMYLLFYLCKNLISIPTFPNITFSGSTSWYAMFFECFNLRSIPYFDTSLVTSFQYTFYRCFNLKYIPKFITSKVTTFYCTFYYCLDLETIPQFDTSSCTSFTSMFEGCMNLIYVPKLDYSKLSGSFTNVFSNCINLKRIIGTIDTKNTTSCSGLFYNCKKLKNLQTEFDLTNCTDISSMFRGCTNLSGKISLLNTSKVTNFSYAFEQCLNIEEIYISDYSKATTLLEFAYCCRCLKKINNINSSSALTNIAYLVGYCNNLKELYIENTSNVTNMYLMIWNNQALLKLTFGSGFSFSKISTASNFRILIERTSMCYDVLKDLLTATAASKPTYSSPTIYFVTTSSSTSNVLTVLDDENDTLATLLATSKSLGWVFINEPTIKPLFVDLGLSVKWMTINMGANTETDYGKYYQWGDVVGYYGSENVPSTLSAYNRLNLPQFTNELPDEYDPVTVKYGDGFRMPTTEEYEELFEVSCVGEYSNNGIQGTKYTASNGNTLFIPYNGYFFDGELTRDSGDYWTKVNAESDGYAYGMYDCDGEDKGTEDDECYYSFGIRGVKEI